MTNEEVRAEAKWPGNFRVRRFSTAVESVLI